MLRAVAAQRSAAGRRRLAGAARDLATATVAAGIVVALFALTFSGVEQGRFEVSELAAVPDRFARVVLEAPAAEEEEPPPPVVPVVVSKTAPEALPEAPEPGPEPEAPPPPSPPKDPGPARSAADAARKLARKTEAGADNGIVGVETGNKEVMGDIADAFGDAAVAMDLEEAALDLDQGDAPVLGDGSEATAKKKAGGRALKNVGGSGKAATWVAETEVTQREWTTVMGTDTRVTSGKWNLPVDQVSWCDAVRFANAKSRKEGRTPAYRLEGSCEKGGAVHWDVTASGYRLLSQAEFARLAATGGVSRRVSLYQNNKDLVDVDADAVATPDGLKGLHDNAREWVWKGSGAGGDPVHSGAASMALHVGCRSGTDRKNVCPTPTDATTRRLGVGLRLARGPVRE